MSKNILIFSDGTGQAGGLKPDQRLSNIYKLYRATRVGPDNVIDPAKQVAFYDAGLGTDVDSSRIPFRLARTVRKFLSSVTGTGISSNIAECYAAILKHYEPGDRIYLFGFSRGAYTVRCLANVLSLCGVPTRGADEMPLTRSGVQLNALAKEAVREVYEHGAGMTDGVYAAERLEKARRFREKYASDDADIANVVPYFIGVFDTVAALGMPLAIRRAVWLGIPSIIAISSAVLGIGLNQPTAALWFALAALSSALIVATWYLASRIRVIHDFPEPGKSHRHMARWSSKSYDLHLDTRVRFARHALAIDEVRKDFARVGWGHRGDVVTRDTNEPEWFQQMWFPGCHSDIGGSYDEDESRLSDIALQWMLEQASAVPYPILVDSTKLNLYPSVEGVQHCEARNLLDSYPSRIPRKWRIGWKEEIRKAVLGAPLHPSVQSRIALDGVSQSGQRLPYRPPGLKEDSRFASFYTPPQIVTDKS